MKSNIKIPARLLKNPLHFLSLGFGSGLSPKAPGTMGTLAAIPIYLLLQTTTTLNLYLLITFLISVLGVYLCGYTSRALKVHDHPGIVIDEIAGYLITMIAAPFSWQNILVGFVLFRIFDIFKPWPISWLDKNMRGGLGIMLDDILAGIISLLILQLLIYIQWLP